MSKSVADMTLAEPLLPLPPFLPPYPAQCGSTGQGAHLKVFAPTTLDAGNPAVFPAYIRSGYRYWLWYRA